MDDPAEDFDSVQWRREDDNRDGDRDTSKGPVGKLKSNGKRRKSASHHGGPPDRNADAVDMAGIGQFGYLECTVDGPQKENDGTKDAFVSYLVTTHSDFKTFMKEHFTVRRRFTDFVYLYKTLFRDYSHVAVPPLPEKHNMSYVRGDRFGSDFTQRRAHALNRFVRRITLHPVLRRNSTFLQFLETPDWNSTMRARNFRSSSLSEGTSTGNLNTSSPPSSSSSAFETFQDWGINLFTKPHKPDKRFLEVREKASKLDDDLSHVEKIVSRVARREGDLEADYLDLATQFRRLVNMEPGVGRELTSFASSVETTSQGLKSLRDATDQDYLTSLHDMSTYVLALKQLLKLREQKQVDFEALTDYLTRATQDRDSLASSGSYSGPAASLTSVIRSKMEDVRGVDHEQSRRDRLRKTEMQIERLTREVDYAKSTSEAFDEQVVNEVAEFERIKAAEMKDCLGSLCEAHRGFWGKTVETWEEFLRGVEATAGEGGGVGGGGDDDDNEGR